MPEVSIGGYNYYYSSDHRFYIRYNSYLTPAEQSDLDNRVKNYDHMLHKSLDELNSERCISSSKQIKKLHRDSQYNNDWKSIIKPILDQEPILSEHFTKEELEKFSLLWIAVLGCYHQSAELLVRSGADVNELFGSLDTRMIDEKWTVLHVLLQMNSSPENERLIRMIVDHGADLQARDYNGCTALHLSVRKGLVQITEMLLKKGADVNAADKDGITPLLGVIRNLHKANELVQLLVKHGADIYVKSSRGENILQYLALWYTNEDVVDLARFFIDKGVSFNEKNYVYHNQPIHPAALCGRNELVKLYLDYGVNVNLLTGQGESPLYLAAELGKYTVMKTLIERGANIHLRTHMGRTALHAALKYASTYRRPQKCGEILIRLLLTAGADVLSEDFEGRTPLAFALSGEYMEHHRPGEEFWPLIEVLALKKALQPSIELKDEKIIERYQKLKDYYQKCADEIDRMKSTRFTDSCTFFELFAKSRCQITSLMRNPNFETKFKLYDLKDFSLYANDIREAFERAQYLFYSMLEKEDVIDEAVYNILPDLIVRKVVHYIFN